MEKVAVFGLGKSGISSVEMLLGCEKQVYAWDDSEDARKHPSLSHNNLIIAHPDTYPWEELLYLVLSPGIPLDFPESHYVVDLARECSLKIICDIDLLYNASPKSKFIGITGTNGKSTTTALIYHIAKNANLNVAMGGNIGCPASSLPILGKDGIYILEVSSYQLDLLVDTNFDISVLLNISPDHIERHGSFEEYIITKSSIFSCYDFQKKAVKIVGIDDPNSSAIYKEIKSITTIPISGTCKPRDGIAVLGDTIYDRTHSVTSKTTKVKRTINGDHNNQNIAAAYTVSKALGISNSKILEGIASFKGLRHRMEYLGEKNGITFINDSKATNAVSTSYALDTFDNILWIVGGVSKEDGINELYKFSSRINHAFLIGEAADDFAETISDKVEYTKSGTLENAFNDAMKIAVSGSVILLSPACASFDQFKNFEERGEIFADLVSKLL